jgi:signal peptidase I
MAAKPQPQNSQRSPAQSPPPAPEKTSGLGRFWRSQRENIQTLVIALTLAILVRVFIAEPRYIPSDSMIPTLEVGDRLVIEKVSYYSRPPAPGEIVVFSPPEALQNRGFDERDALIKRVVATPGQTIAVNNGRILIDGQPRPEDYIAEPIDYVLPPLEVPAGSVFVLGDNRNNSNDSHVWGPLPAENVIGRAVFRFWPPDRFGVLPSASDSDNAIQQGSRNPL